MELLSPVYTTQWLSWLLVTCLSELLESKTVIWASNENHRYNHLILPLRLYFLIASYSLPICQLSSPGKEVTVWRHVFFIMQLEGVCFPLGQSERNAHELLLYPLEPFTQFCSKQLSICNKLILHTIGRYYTGNKLFINSLHTCIYHSYNQ